MFAAFLGALWAPGDETAAFVNADLCAATLAALMTLLLWYDFFFMPQQNRAQLRASLLSGHVTDAKVFLESQTLGTKVNKHKKCCSVLPTKNLVDEPSKL